MKIDMSIENGLVVEDLRDSRQWLENILQDSFNGINVASADCVEGALQLVSHQSFDIALIDLGLPDGSGVEVIAQLNQAHPNCIIIVSSIFDDDQHLFTALRAGATGYVLKDLTSEDMIGMLKGIASGKPPLSPAIARRLLNFFQPDKNIENKQEKLTQRERDVLQLIAKGYTIPKAAEMLGIAHSTTASYVKAIYRKLNVSSRAEATLEASRRGIISINSQ